MDDDQKTPLAPMVIVLRVTGCLLPLAAIVINGTANLPDELSIGILLSSLIGTLFCFTAGSLVRLLDRIDKGLARSRSVATR